METRSSNRKVGIIGAGIAGLAAAIALRNEGWDVEVSTNFLPLYKTGVSLDPVRRHRSGTSLPVWTRIRLSRLVPGQKAGVL